MKRIAAAYLGLRTGLDGTNCSAHGARQLARPQRRENTAKLALAGLIALTVGVLVLLDVNNHGFRVRFNTTLLFVVLELLVMVGLNRFMGPTQFFADIKWILIFDVIFASIVAISYSANTTLTQWLFNAIRLQIDAVGNAVFALTAVRLLWCFRDANGDFLRMPPLNFPGYIAQAILNRTFSLTTVLAGVVAALGVGALAFGIFVFISSLSYSEAYMLAILILAAGAFPSVVSMVSVLMAKKMARGTIAEAQAQAQAQAEE